MNKGISYAATYERVRRIANNWMWAVKIQHRRIQSVEPEDEEFCLRKWLDIHFLIIALLRLKKLAKRLQNVPGFNKGIKEAIKKFDNAVPNLEKLRNVAEHLDDYVIDKGKDKGVSREALEVASLKNGTWTWFNNYSININKALKASKSLFKAIIDSKFEFENWFVTALGGQPYKSSGGGDSGIDGFMYFRDFEGKPHTVILSVKGGSYSLSMVRDLCRVVERENAAMGVLLALEPPTKGMLSEASSAGRFQMPGVTRTYPKVQIFTVEDYFAGKRPDLPDVSDTLKKAKRITKAREEQEELGI